MHNRDTTVLIDLLSCTTPACFSTFFQSIMISTLVENSLFFSVLVFELFFGNTIIMIMIEIQHSRTALLLPMHTTSKQWNRAPQLYQLSSEKNTLRCQLCSTRSLYSGKNQQLFKITSAIKVTPMKIMDDLHYKWKPSHAYHKINTIYSEQIWMGHKRRPW